MSHADPDIEVLDERQSTRHAGDVPHARERMRPSRDNSGRKHAGTSPVLGARELYVYWRTHDVDKALRAASRMQAVLKDRISGLEAELHQRESTSDGRFTLMEIYRHPQGIDGPLETIISNAAGPVLATLMASPRVVEAFRPCVQAP
jgi:hypothetical protein